MAAFLRENWIWIVAPIVPVVALVAFVIVSGGGDLGECVYVIH